MLYEVLNYQNSNFLNGNFARELKKNKCFLMANSNQTHKYLREFLTSHGIRSNVRQER
jgi:hypothetical protein